MASPFASLKKTKRLPLRPLPGLSSRESRHSDVDTTECGNCFCSDLVCPPDHDLIGLMASRLSAAEGKIRLQNKEMAEKDMKIQMLEEKVKMLSMKLKDGNQSAKLSEIEQKYLQLQKQVFEMEEFLADYGLVWVGKSGPSESDNDESSPSNASDAVWTQSDSLPRENYIDFELLVNKINELNIVSGEGVSKVERTADGARLKAPNPINFILYANGIVLFNGPFRPFSDPDALNVVRDIIDGYFPSELQSRYPDGVPFKLFDRRTVHFKDIRSELFNGEGQTLGGNSETSRLLRNTNSARRRASAVEKVVEETVLPGPKLTVDQFVNKLPKSVIKNGQVVDVRQSVRQHLQPTPGSTVSKEIDCRVSAENSATPDQSQQQTVSLRVLSDDGGIVTILKMFDTNTIGDIRNILNKERKWGSKPYSIVSTFPHRVYDDDSATLLQCGLTSNATLHLRYK